MRLRLHGLATLLTLPLLAATAGAEISPDAAASLGSPRGRPLAGTELEARTEAVGGLLRCPVCQGLSVSDSPSSMARNMRETVRDLLAGGYDEEQVLLYFERSYGEFVRLKPPLRGANWLVWIGPGLGLLAGLVIVKKALAPSPSKRLDELPRPPREADLAKVRAEVAARVDPRSRKGS